MPARRKNREDWADEGGKGWKTISIGTTCGERKIVSLGRPAKGRVFRRGILEAGEVPTISEFQWFE